MSSFKKDDEKTHTAHEDIAAAAQHGFKTNGVLPYAHSAAGCGAVDEIFPYKCQSEIIEPFSAKPHSLLRSLLCIKEA